MLEFIAAVYNEADEVEDLINHIGPYVDRLNFVDDFSIDETPEILEKYRQGDMYDLDYKVIRHTGLCEVARIHALEMCENDSWVLMCDADERFTDLPAIEKWINSVDSEPYTHVYFDQVEYIDGVRTRGFTKAKLFRKSAVTLSPIIHEDPSFSGNPANLDWTVIHRKTSAKQKMREKEYIETYNKLVQEGKIEPGKRDWFLSLHYYEKG